MNNRKKRLIGYARKKEFYIMNIDSMFFKGLLGGDIVWTDVIEEAKIFDDKSKITVISRWKPLEKMQIVFK